MDKEPEQPPAAPLEYANLRNTPSRRAQRGPSALLILLLTGLGLFLVAAFLLPSMGRARKPANRIKCASNLRQIAMACILYSQTNPQGAFPDSVARLFEETELTAECFICPSTDAKRAEGPTTRATAQLLQNSPPPGGSGHCQSYLYFGKGVTADSPPTMVVACDYPSNHKNNGGNVVYADAHAEWKTAAELAAIIAAVQAGQNPPP